MKAVTMLQEAVDLIDLPGRTFHVEPGMRMVQGRVKPCESLVIKFRAPNADDERRRRKDYEWRAIAPPFGDVKTALRWVMAEIIHNEVHELCEFTVVDGRRAFDPHQGLEPDVQITWPL
jgi:hypothetical protein